MGGRGSKSGLVSPRIPQVDSNGFSDTDTSPFHDLYNGRSYYNQQNLDIDARTALKDWLDPNTTRGSLYNFSQNTNYAVANGQALDAQQQYAYDSIKDAMHNAGYNINLTRYDHGEFLDDLLRGAGYSGNGHTGMSVSQLKQVLVGHEYTDQRILSTSYNNFKNASDPSTFTTREIKISYQTPAGTQVVMPGRGPGGDFGEMLLGPSTGQSNRYRVKDIKATGSKARPKGGSKYNLNLQQIEVAVEIY